MSSHPPPPGSWSEDAEETLGLSLKPNLTFGEIEKAIEGGDEEVVITPSRIPVPAKGKGKSNDFPPLPKGGVGSPPPTKSALPVTTDIATQAKISTLLGPFKCPSDGKEMNIQFVREKLSRDMMMSSKYHMSCHGLRVEVSKNHILYLSPVTLGFKSPPPPNMVAAACVFPMITACWMAGAFGNPDPQPDFKATWVVCGNRPEFVGWPNLGAPPAKVVACLKEALDSVKKFAKSKDYIVIHHQMLYPMLRAMQDRVQYLTTSGTAAYQRILYETCRAIRFGETLNLPNRLHHEFSKDIGLYAPVEEYTAHLRTSEYWKGKFTDTGRTSKGVFEGDDTVKIGTTIEFCTRTLVGSFPDLDAQYVRALAIGYANMASGQSITNDKEIRKWVIQNITAVIQGVSATVNSQRQAEEKLEQQDDVIKQLRTQIMQLDAEIIELKKRIPEAVPAQVTPPILRKKGLVWRVLDFMRPNGLLTRIRGLLTRG